MEYSSLVLAFIGDSVFELKIREYFINSGLAKVKDLQQKCSSFASAQAHFNIMEYILEEDIFNEEELNVYKRGRNAKVNQRRKNFNPKFYHASTGFESVIGHLYVTKQEDRIDELILLILERFK
ncbi:MAG: ribonuclease III domain-containing protein [Erysipelotrichales bacterium]